MFGTMKVVKWLVTEGFTFFLFVFFQFQMRFFPLKTQSFRFLSTLEFKEILKNDLKREMLNKNKAKVSLIKQIKSEMLNREKDQKKFTVYEMLLSLVKKRRQAIAEFLKENRNDLAEIEENEILQLQNYLPPATSLPELRKIIEKIVLENKLKSVKDLKVLLAEVDKLGLNISKQDVVKEARSLLG
jgi:uncharacterized protein YqeY